MRIRDGPDTDRGWASPECVLLPAGARAIVEPSKVRDYLLSLSHPVGHPKALYFLRLGFRQSDWYLLRDELLRIGREGEAFLVSESSYGQKYVVRGILEGPWRRQAPLTTVWIVTPEDKGPRLVTAYPT